METRLTRRRVITRATARSRSKKVRIAATSPVAGGDSANYCNRTNGRAIICQQDESKATTSESFRSAAEPRQPRAENLATTPPRAEDPPDNPAKGGRSCFARRAGRADNREAGFGAANQQERSLRPLWLKRRFAVRGSRCGPRHLRRQS